MSWSVELSKDLKPSGHPPTRKLGPVTVDRSKRLRQILEQQWRRQLSKMAAVHLDGVDVAPVLPGWKVDIGRVADGDMPGCEGLLSHDHRGSVALRLPNDWHVLYERGWSFCDGALVLAVLDLDQQHRPNLALVARWSVTANQVRGGWRAVLAPWWSQLLYPAPGQVRVVSLDRTKHSSVLSGLPAPWPLNR